MTTHINIYFSQSKVNSLNANYVVGCSYSHALDYIYELC